MVGVIRLVVLTRGWSVGSPAGTIVRILPCPTTATSGEACEEDEEKYEANYHNSQNNPTDPVIPRRVFAYIVVIVVVTATLISALKNGWHI